MEKKIILNGQTMVLPPHIVNLEQLLDWKGIAKTGTAVAINGKIVKSTAHSFTELNNLDNVMILSAAYGG